MDTTGWVFVAALVGLVMLNVAWRKGWLSKGDGTASGSGKGLFSTASIDQLAVEFAQLISKIHGVVVLSFAGRQAIRSVLLFLMVCLDTIDDEVVRTECKQDLKKLDGVFFDPPASKATTINNQVEPKSKPVVQI